MDLNSCPTCGRPLKVGDEIYESAWSVWVIKPAIAENYIAPWVFNNSLEELETNYCQHCVPGHVKRFLMEQKGVAK